ncbi:MAG: OFA family MFS transporter [Planctomycetes bacterium]|nr:OFA family MFS transporter [Planctomycetota bacterium]
MSDTNVRNRWSVVIGALLVQICLGAIYAWGTFATKLQDVNGAHKFTETQTSIIFSVTLVVFAAVMILAGRLQDKYGPRKIAITGVLILSAGYILAGTVGGASFTALLVFIGIMGGAGIGLAYVCPIAACVKWFPDMKGLVTGLAVAGFGAGASLFIKFAGAWLHLLEKHGVMGTMLIYGIAIGVLATIGGALLCNPPEGWKPKNWAPAKHANGAAQSVVADLTQSQIIRTPQFWMIWTSMALTAGCGLMVIKCLKTFGERALIAGGSEPVAAAAAAGSALALYSIFNGAGRIAWGAISHKLGAKGSIVLLAALQALMMFVLFKMGGSQATLAVAACWIGFNYGGCFSLFPLITLESFGSRNVGANYGAVFTSYGIGSIAGPVLAGMVRDNMGTFTPAFVGAAIACVVATLITAMLRPVKAKQQAMAKAA